MSVVAVKKYNDHIVISADTIAVKRDKLYSNNKLFKISDNFVIGAVGRMVTIDYIEDFFSSYLKTYVVQPSKKSVNQMFASFYNHVLDSIQAPEKTELVNSFIVVWDGKIYEIDFISEESHYEVSEINEMATIGYGDYAMGAMMQGATPEQAIEISAKLCIYVSCPIVTYMITNYLPEEPDILNTIEN